MTNKKFLMPRFLKPDFSDFNFDFEDDIKQTPKEKLKQELLLVYGKTNTVILLDGVVIYKKIATGIEVTSSKANKCVVDYLKKPTNSFLLNQNKKHLNNTFVINFKTKNKKQKLNLIFVATKQIYHACFFNVEKDVSVQVFKKVIGLKGAKASLVLNATTKENGFLNLSTFYDLQSERSQVVFGNLTACKNSNLAFNSVNLSSANVMDVAYGHLMGQGANIECDSFNFASGSSVFKKFVHINHKAKHSSSSIDNVAISNNFAKVEIDGIGEIGQGFSKSNAQQKNQFIALDETAKAIANPQLIIKEHDVQAGHSAGIGGLDPQQLYYLQSRGLKLEAAKELIIIGLAQRFLSDFSVSEKNKVVKLIKAKIKKQL